MSTAIIIPFPLHVPKCRESSASDLCIWRNQAYQSALIHAFRAGPDRGLSTRQGFLRDQQRIAETAGYELTKRDFDL